MNDVDRENGGTGNRMAAGRQETNDFAFEVRC